MNCASGSDCGCSPGAAQTGKAHTYRPQANVVETAEAYHVTLDVPGSSTEAIDVQVHEGILSIVARVQPRDRAGARPLSREFGVGDFRRQFRVGEDVDAAAISARYSEGVLAIELPKARRAEGRRIAVAAG